MKHYHSLRRRGAPGRRGNATLVALVAVMVLGGMSGGILALTVSSQKEAEAATESLRARFAAEAGVANAIEQLTYATSDAGEAEATALALQGGGVIQGGGDIDLSICNLGSSQSPAHVDGGVYWADVAPSGGDFFTILSNGQSGERQRRIEVVVQENGNPLFENALFAGNSSGDPNYTLDLGGTGGQADEVTGDVYSGGNIDVTGDAAVDGAMRASGTISPGGGTEGITQTPPDLAGMDYASTADFDVVSLFSTATPQPDNAGGTAWQLPEDNPAHIFRRNPSDRAPDNASTSKDDYYLEDPYETVSRDEDMDGSDPFRITLSGIGGEPGPDGNEAVYYIDGNLWLHNKKTFSFQFYNSGDEPIRVTFVVKGNVYFSDNLFYQDEDEDGVAFIALTDPDVENSGNIYFGDPEFGTLEEMHAFMYAENNFYDNNLDEEGSSDVRVLGNMTAGNQVLINRDYGDEHSKLTVDLDERMALGTITLPGIPDGLQGAEAFTIVSWRELAAD